MLEVSGLANPPEPIDPTPNAGYEEGTPIQVSGFPFGQALAQSAISPVVTVRRALVSGVRHSEDGEVVLIQLEGMLNNGNSGGPVVTADGILIGVAVAVIPGTPFALAVPWERVAEVLRGWLTVTHADAVEAVPHGWKVKYEAAVADQFGRIKSARLLLRDGLHGEPLPVARGEDGTWPRLPDARLLALSIGTRTATATKPNLRRPVWV